MSRSSCDPNPLTPPSSDSLPLRPAPSHELITIPPLIRPALLPHPLLPVQLLPRTLLLRLLLPPLPRDPGLLLLPLLQRLGGDVAQGGVVRVTGFEEVGGGFGRGDLGARFGEAVDGRVEARGEEDAFGLWAGRGRVG